MISSSQFPPQSDIHAIVNEESMGDTRNSVNIIVDSHASEVDNSDCDMIINSQIAGTQSSPKQSVVASQEPLGQKQNTCVSANMPKKKNCFGRSENLFFFFFFV